MTLMGLKQMVSKAMIDKAMQGDDEAVAAVAALPPVQISGEAHRAYADMVRKWTGWSNAALKFAEPEVSPFASCNRKTHVVTANPERLLLNPNRVLLTVNPFRLRQEAVLTGALLHEAGHARHSNWIPRNEIDAGLFKHSDGSEVTSAEMSLAKCMEEPRIEGIIANEASVVGDLGWTMRASAAHLVPMTDLSADPEQAIMDLVVSWALRAGRQVALSYHVTSYAPPLWVGTFTSLLHATLTDHLIKHYGEEDRGRAVLESSMAIGLLSEMARGTGESSTRMFRADAAAESDTGTFMIGRAKRVLNLLFPETAPDDMPEASGGCGAGEGGEGVSDLPGDADEAGEAGAGEPAEGEAEGEAAGTESGAEAGEGEGEAAVDAESDVAKALREMETKAKTEAVEQGKADTKAGDSASGAQGGAGSGSAIGGGWRRPTIDERVTKTNAERFLRDLIEPNVASKVRITDQPSSLIDGAALAAWKAGGQVKAPRFFQQVKRTTKPTPPVKIAVLVDVSASMDEMQKPSAILSWALAAACLDLRNYAGGGVMIESTLIHWGSTARVIQRNGEVLPGIREVGCHDGTTAMDSAMELIEEQIPGFFDVKEQAENKLLVQFTDWKLAPHTRHAAGHWVGRALESGVSMLSVVPRGYNNRYTSLPDILANAKIQRGRNHLMEYDPRRPEAVWDNAAQSLGY